MAPRAHADPVWTRQGLLLAHPATNPRWVSHAQAPTAIALSDHCWRVFFSGRDGENRSHVYYADFDPTDDFRLMHLQDRPVLGPGTAGAFDSHGAGPATALRVGGQIWLYYSGISLRTDVPYEIAVGLAVSDDEGRSFRRVWPGPVIGRGPHDPFFVSTPCVWHMEGHFHALYNSATRWVQLGDRWECCYDLRAAWSGDGVHWMQQPAPALRLQEGEAGLARPWVVSLSGGYRMWFSRRGLHDFRDAGGQNYRIASASAPDGLHWQRGAEDLRWAAPCSPDDWDSWMQAYPCVLPLGKEWIMFYNGNDFGRGGFGWARAPQGTREPS